jgi:hypothetical protein
MLLIQRNLAILICQIITQKIKCNGRGGCNQGEYRSDIYAFVDEYLEEAIKNSSIYEADEDVDYEYWSSNHNAHATFIINNFIHRKSMNLLLLHEKYHISILDGCADTYV